MTDLHELFINKCFELREGSPKRTRDSVVLSVLHEFPTLLREEVEAMYDGLYPDEAGRAALSREEGR